MSSTELISRSDLELFHAQDRTMPDWLLNNAGAGICISGSSGEGKSVLIRNLVDLVSRDNESAVFLLDPHGDLAREIANDCLASRLLSKRLVHAKIGERNGPVFPLNPLAYFDDGKLTPFDRAKRIFFRVDYTTHLLIRSWGQQHLDTTPRLAHWTRAILMTLSRAGLPFAAASEFFDIGSETYHQLIRFATRSDRIEFERLAEMKLADQEDQISSTKTRIQGMLRDPNLLSTLGAVDGCVDIRSLVQDKAIVLVDLSCKELELTDGAREIIGNLWLSEILQTAFATPAHERRPLTLVCDELPTFRLSKDLITHALTQIRKFRIRFVGAFQGVESFADSDNNDGSKDPLLRNMMQCRTRFFFKHTDPDSCDHFARIAIQPTLNPHLVKFEHYEQEQYQDGHDLYELFGQSFSENESSSQQTTDTEAESEFESAGTVDSATEGQGGGQNFGSGTNDTLTVTTDDAREAGQLITARGHGSQQQSGESTQWSNASTQATSHQKGTGKSRSRALGSGSSSGTQRGVTINQSLVPRLKWRERLAFMEFFTLDDQIRLTASFISRLRVGEPIMAIAGEQAVTIRIAMLPNRFARAPKTLRKVQEEYEARLRQLGFVWDAEVLLNASKNLLPQRIEQIEAIEQRSSQKRLTFEVVQPEDDDEMGI